MTTAKIEIVNRWLVFLEKIEVRFNESLEQAQEACLSILEESNYDYHIVFLSWNAIKSQLQSLSNIVHDTWKKKVLPHINNESHLYITEEKQSEFFTTMLQEKLSHFQISLERKLSTKFQKSTSSQVKNNIFSYNLFNQVNENWDSYWLKHLKSNQASLAEDINF